MLTLPVGPRGMPVQRDQKAAEAAFESLAQHAAAERDHDASRRQLAATKVRLIDEAQAAKLQWVEIADATGESVPSVRTAHYRAQQHAQRDAA